MVSREEARRELARRELARRRSAAPAQEADAPWYQDAAQAAGDLLRLGSNAVTLGFRDKLAPMLSGRSVEEERAMTDEASERAGTAGFAAEIGGGMALPGGLAKTGYSLAAAPAAQAMTGIKGLLARSGLMGLEGEALSSLTAAGNDQGYQPGIGMAAGAGGNVLGEGISSGIGKVAQALTKKPGIPTNEALRDAAQGAYKQADEAGVIFRPQGVQRMANDIRVDLAEFGFHPQLQPRVATVLDELERIQTGNVTFKGMDVLRRIADSARKSLDPSEKAIGNRIVSHIDDFMENMEPGGVLTGNAQEAGASLKRARDLWSRMRKSEMVDTAVEKAERRAASTGSGGNADNATRQNIRGILDNPRKSRGFKPDEIEAMEKVVRGTTGQNAMRLAGKLSPQGSGLMAALGLGATVANPLMATVPAVGMVAKALADKATPRNVEQLSRIIRAGGQKSATLPAKGATQLLAEQKRDAIARALMSIGVQQGTRLAGR